MRGDVAVGKSWWSWKTSPKRRRWVGTVRRSSPSHATRPWSGTRRPAITRSSVLARPARAEQADNLPGTDGQADLVEHHAVAEPDGHPVDLEHRSASLP